MSLPDLSHEVQLAPEFYDVDPMRVVWHGHYARFVEVARSALLARFDYGYEQMLASGFSWPVVDMRVKYMRPAVLGQNLRIRAEIVEWENRLRIVYRVHDQLTGVRLTTASTIQLAVDSASGELQYVCPPVLWDRLGVVI